MGEIFIERFGVPQVALEEVNTFFSEEEINFVEKINKDIFEKEDVEKIIDREADDFIAQSYHRGIISIDDEQKKTYTLCNFKRFLDIFVVSETAKYKGIEEGRRKSISDWYFEEYYKTKDPDPNVKASPDEIMTVDEICDFIDSQDRPVYLNYCDCRSFAGDCGKPTKTCITYHNEPNSFVHRGLSEEIDKERAKQVVRDADKAGLMHTANPNGICNCCRDCCYLFKAQDRRGSHGIWPASKHKIVVHQDKCIGCGKCQKRCYFNVFEIEDRKAKADVQKCVGCGICATGCPVGAIEVVDL